MPLSLIPSTEPLFKNYTKFYRYNNIPLKYTPAGIDAIEQDSVVRISQRLEDAEPYMFRDRDNWIYVNDDITLEELTLDTEVALNNIHKLNTNRRVLGVISGNIIWNYTEIGKLYQLKVTMDLSVGAEPYTSSLFISPKTNSDKYYFTLAVPDDNRDINIQSEEELNTGLVISAELWDMSTNTVNSDLRYGITRSDDNKLFKLHKMRINSDEITFFDYHNVDFIIASEPTRIMQFDSLADPVPDKLKKRKTLQVKVGDTRRLRDYAIEAGWGPPFEAIADNPRRNIQVTAFTVFDRDDPNTPTSRELNQLYKIKGGSASNIINCTAVYKTISLLETVTLTKNDKRTWSRANTTTEDMSGTFGEITYSLPNAVNGTQASVIVDLEVNSSNQKLTKTGLNNSKYVETYKGSNSKTETVLVTIQDQKIRVFGNWYLQSGSWNYLHPNENNWHDGSGSFTIKSITYQRNKA